MIDLGNFEPLGQSKKNIRDRANRKKYPRASGYSKPHNKNNLETRWLDGEAPDFTAWDGEGYTANDDSHHYMLFGSSVSRPIVGVSLHTLEILEYIDEVCKNHPHNINISFAFSYDVNMILRDLSELHLHRLHDLGECTFRGWTISHIPGKMFTVWRGSRGKYRKRGWTIFDIFSFSMKSYVSTLEDWGLGDNAVMSAIIAGKLKRGGNTFEDLPEVKAYWQDEISLMPKLAEIYREHFYQAGLFITSWHGTGALAGYMLDHNKVDSLMSKHNKRKTPAGVKLASRHAYAGGRFWTFNGGLYEGPEPVKVADQNSAYVSAARMLPNLATGIWRRGNLNVLREATKVQAFGLYRVQWDMCRVSIPRRPCPFFFRSEDGSLSWPTSGEGWYWGPEINAALACGLKDGFQIEESWIYEDDGTRPFTKWIENAYNIRLRYKQAGNKVERSFKMALAAMYGQFAQRVGWNKHTKMPPSRHQLEWAGFITSWCRAEMQKVAYEIEPDKLISIDTDGICVIGDIPNLDIGNGLGQWSIKEHDGILQWSSGIYWLRSHGVWDKGKTRGIPRGSAPIDLAMEAITRLDSTPYSLDKWLQCKFTQERSTFVGYSLALAQGKMETWRRWIPEEVTSVFGGNHHTSKACRKCQGQDRALHEFLPTPPQGWGAFSEQHELPWLMPDKELLWNVNGSVQFDLEDPHFEEILHDIDY